MSVTGQPSVVIEAASSGRKLQLKLSHESSFVVLAGSGSVPTCYTDRGGTSRTAECSRAALVEFARQVLQIFGGDAAAQCRKHPSI